MQPTSSQITITSIGIDAISLSLAGEIDAVSAPAIARHLEPLVAAYAHVELDLRGVTFMDSEGVKPLLRAAAEAQTRGDSLVVTALSHPARRFLDAISTVAPGALALQRPL